MSNTTYNNESNVDLPNFEEILTAHALCCRELLNTTPSPRRLLELAQNINTYERSMPLLREFREEVPHINFVVQEAFAFANLD